MFPNTVSQLLQEALCMEQQWYVKNQLSADTKKVQSLRQTLLAGR